VRAESAPRALSCFRWLGAIPPEPMRALRLVLPLFLLAAACGGGNEAAPPANPPPAPPPPPAPTAAAPAAPAPPRIDASLIPRNTLFENPERIGVQISPDGQWLSFLAPVDGVLNVMVAPADDPSKAQPATHDRARPVLRYQWTKKKNTLLYLQDAAGDENWHVYEVSLPGGEPKDLTPYKAVNAELAGISARRPGEVLIGMNDRDAKYHDLYTVDLATGARKLLARNEGFAGYVADDDFQVKLAFQSQADGSITYFAPGPKKALDAPYMTVPFDDALTTQPQGFDETGRTLYLLDSRGRDTAALFAMDFASKKATLLAEDPKADIEGTLLHPRTHRPLVALSNYDRRRHILLDRSLKADEDYLKTVVPDADFNLDSCTDDFRRCVVSFEVSDGPLRYYLYDRTKHKAAFLFVHRSKLEKLRLAKMTPVVIQARDGTPLVSYLSLPPGSDTDGDGNPDHPMPMVLLVHGGPWARDTWGYDRDHQWLANRGYAVLSVNFRGSTGFGKKFVNAANGEWAGKMHDDLVDAVMWAEKSAIADPQKVAIYGGSYGGYAALVGLSFTPELFACGVDLFGPSNLVTLEQSIPPYWAPMIEQLARRVGDHRTDDGQKALLARSPITRASAITRPLLIEQGANDVRVKQTESDQIVKAMQARGIPVTYLLLSDEGHGFLRPENAKAVDAVAETFLAQCLGGSYEPVGSDFKGSTLQVPSGADQVYGLADALKASR